ncbi:MAG: ATPase, T2SS/T4P/T4SS family, partial [Pyrinomonadaceae bacterium]
MSLKLGELLVRENLITTEQLREGLEYQRTNGGRLGTVLVKLGMVSDDVITAVLSRKYGVPSINLDLFHIDAEVVRLISQDVALKYSVMPLSKMGATLTLAMADPTNVFAIDDIKFMTSLSVEPVIASETSIQIAIGKYYGGSNQIDIFDAAFAIEAEKAATSKNGGSKNGGSKNGNSRNGHPNLKTGEKINDSDLDVNLDNFEFGGDGEEEFEVVQDNEEIDLAALARASEDAPVVRLVNVLLVDSLRRGASDIHVEPYERDFRIRFRIDGVLYDVMHPPMQIRDPLISRLKIMSKLDIAEKRLPQDGRIKIRYNESGEPKEIDFRVSVLPTLFGEKIVLRLLDKDKLMLDMSKLGFEVESLAKFEVAILKPWGMVLV